MRISLPLLLNIIVLALSVFLQVSITNGRISYRNARNIQMAIIVLDIALVVVNLLSGNILFAILWGVVVFSNLYGSGFLR